MIRFALCCEFLLAVVAVYTLWSQVGGQYHLDLMAWPWKLGLGCGLSYVIVRAAAAAIEHEKSWNAAVFRWLAAALAIALLIGAVTYYYHWNEPPEEEEEAAGIRNALHL